MTSSMPDIVKVPPRPATTAKPQPQAGDASGTDPQDGDFAGLLDEAADEVDVTEAPSRGGVAKGRPKTPKPDSTAKAVATDPAATDPIPPLMPWLTAPAPPAPQAAGTTATATTTAPAVAPTAPAPPGTATVPLPATEVPADAMAGATATTAPPAPMVTPGATSVADSAAANQPASSAPTPVPPPQPAQPQTVALTNPPKTDATVASASPTDATPPLATPGVPPTAHPVAAPQTALPALSSPAIEAPAPETAIAAEPRRQGRGGARTANATPARAGAEGAKADPTAAQATAQAIAAPTAPDGPAPTKGDALTGTPATLSGGAGNTGTPGGLDALPTLPAQAATQYAAASASGRAPAAHGGPPMAQLAAPLVRVAEAGGGAFHIDLAPAELGRVRVVAEVSDGQVTLSVQAEHADTLALLRRDMTHLEKALGESGLKLDSTTLNFSLQGDSQSRGFSAPDQGGGGAQGSWRGPATAAVPDAPPERAMRPLDGLVDVII